METYLFCISSSLMLLFGLDGGYTLLVGTAQGLVLGILHYCASCGKCVCLRVRVPTCWSVSKAGQVRFQVWVRQLQRGVEATTPKERPAWRNSVRH
jgi:hypothetical protein